MHRGAFFTPRVRKLFFILLSGYPFLIGSGPYVRIWITHSNTISPTCWERIQPREHTCHIHTIAVNRTFRHQLRRICCTATQAPAELEILLTQWPPIFLQIAKMALNIFAGFRGESPKRQASPRFFSLLSLSFLRRRARHRLAIGHRRPQSFAFFDSKVPIAI